jgi:hypothetical protein
MSAPYYSVVSTHAKYGTFTYENDHITKPIEEQLRVVADLVWSGQWDDVTACHLIDPAKGTCVDAMAELVEAVDAQSKRLDVEPHADIADLIRRVLKREPWLPPLEDEPEEYALPAVELRARQTTHRGL